MEKNIVIRVDGGSDVPNDLDRKRGLGHIMRCIPLAKALSAIKDVRILFIMKDHPKGVEKVVGAGYDVEKIPVDLSENEDLLFVKKIIDRIKPLVVINDILNTRIDYVRMLKNSGVFVLNEDDLGPGKEIADVLVYSLTRPNAVNPKIFSGPEYMTLKEEFSKIHKKKRITRKKVRNILVSMGAGDPRALTIKVVSAFEAVHADAIITIVLGSAFTFHDELNTILKTAKKKCVVKNNVTNMAELMYDSDLAIISGGIIVYEVAAAGLPAIVLCQNEHEYTNVFEDYGFAIKLGMGVDVQEEQLTAAIDRLIVDFNARVKMSTVGKSLVDGMGAERVAEIIRKEILIR